MDDERRCRTGVGGNERASVSTCENREPLAGGVVVLGDRPTDAGVERAWGARRRRRRDASIDPGGEDRRVRDVVAADGIEREHSGGTAHRDGDSFEPTLKLRVRRQPGQRREQPGELRVDAGGVCGELCDGKRKTTAPASSVRNSSHDEPLLIAVDELAAGHHGADFRAEHFGILAVLADHDETVAHRSPNFAANASQSRRRPHRRRRWRPRSRRLSGARRAAQVRPVHPADKRRDRAPGARARGAIAPPTNRSRARALR